MSKKDIKSINPNEINPIDYFNKNCVHETFLALLKKPSIQRTAPDALTFVANKSDMQKRMIVVNKDNNTFEAKMQNGLFMPVGKEYTPFMMMQEFVFKRNFNTTLNYVITDIMNNKSDYIRVGVKYLKKVLKTDRYGITRTTLKPWDKVTIIDDHGKQSLDFVNKFHDFTIVPDNKSWQPEIESNYNLYAPFEHLPCSKSDYKGIESFKWIWQLLNHIFGDQIELGLIYMKCLYDYPTQILPILVLTSVERQTGKSTFIDFLNVLFGANTVVINPSDISNSFNSSYADKNIIMIEESRFESVQSTEKLKNLSTQKEISVNAKFVAQYTVEFFGKIIITSNDEEKFSKVDTDEIRYWIRTIPTLEGKANHNILDDMAKEIPAFLHYLNVQPIPDRTKSRQVFTVEELDNKALQVVKKESRPELAKEIEIHLDNHCMQNHAVEMFEFTSSDIKKLFFKNNHNIAAPYINKMIRNFMKLDKCKKAKRYVPLEAYGHLNQDSIIGKPYTLKNPHFGLDLSVDTEPKDDEDLPF